MKRSLPVLCLLLALALSGCGEDADPTVLVQADSGEEVVLRSGERFEVHLESNPSTGYAWRVEPGSAPELLDLVSSSYEPPAEDLVGAAGVEVLVFEARRGGAEILRLEYVREFDTSAAPERVVEFIIQIDGVAWTRPAGPAPATSTASAPGVDDVGDDDAGDAEADADDDAVDADDDDAVDAGDVDDVDVAVSVGELRADREPYYVLVSGYVVWDSSGARLCETLAESFPPQCGGSSVVIVDPIQLDPEIEFQQDQGVRWTDGHVSIGGVLDGKELVLLEQAGVDR
ncbi:MAG: protease inhibitor I42 family protein [Acidimicrobiales bacterium]